MFLFLYILYIVIWSYIVKINKIILVRTRDNKNG